MPVTATKQPGKGSVSAVWQAEGRLCLTQSPVTNHLRQPRLRLSWQGLSERVCARLYVPFVLTLFCFFLFCLSRSSKTCRRLLHLPVHHHLWVHHYSVETRIFQLRPIDVLKFGCNSNIIDENKNHQAQSQNKYCTSLCRQQKLSFVILLKGIFLHDRKYDWYHYHIFVWSMNMHKPILVLNKQFILRAPSAKY